MDIDHWFGGDTDFSDGDSLTTNGSGETQRLIIRRLCTAPGDYMWHPEYGAGLRGYVGASISSLRDIERVCVGQILLEEGVASTPPPTVTLNSVGGVLTASISYTDALTSTLDSFSFDI